MENGHLPVFTIYDQNGVSLGAISLSEKSQELLEDGEYITVLYHTPRALTDQLGRRNGAFALYKEGDRILTDNPAQVTEYLDLQVAIQTAQAGNA